MVSEFFCGGPARKENLQWLKRIRTKECMSVSAALSQSRGQPLNPYEVLRFVIGIS